MTAISQIVPRLDDTAQRLLWKLAGLLTTWLGHAGSVRVADTATYSGSFGVFHALTDSTVSVITYASGSGGVAAGDTITTGDRIYGQITSFALSSGSGELFISAIQ